MSIGGGGSPGLVLTFSHRIAGEIEAITIVDEAIEDGVGQSRIAEAGMPLLDRKLAGEDRGFLVVASVEDFEQIALGLIGDGGNAEVVDDQQIDLGEKKLERLCIAAAFVRSSTRRGRR